MATDNKGLNLPPFNFSNWDVPLNENFTWIDLSLGETVNINAAGVGPALVPFTEAQYRCAIINFSGALTNNVLYDFPATIGGFWIIRNSTSNAFTLSISVNGGTSVVIPQDQIRSIYSDGNNSVRYSDVFGANTQVIFNDSGIMDGDADFTFDKSANTLSVNRALLKVGSAAAPALASQTEPGSGMFFNTKDVVFATDGVRRTTINSSGAIGLGSSPSYGASGEVMKSRGTGNTPLWEISGAVEIDSKAATGGAVIFNALDLSKYSILVGVMKNVTHNAGANRTVAFGGHTVTPVFNAVSISGLAFVHLNSSVAAAINGNDAATSTFASGFVSNITKASTSVRFDLSSTGSFDGGSFSLMGIA